MLVVVSGLSSTSNISCSLWFGWIGSRWRGRMYVAVKQVAFGTGTLASTTAKGRGRQGSAILAFNQAREVWPHRPQLVAGQSAIHLWPRMEAAIIWPTTRQSLLVLRCGGGYLFLFLFLSERRERKRKRVSRPPNASCSPSWPWVFRAAS